jgi:L-cystine uptake protein TcyP (sodium:dicarboxylate symporter family)
MEKTTKKYQKRSRLFKGLGIASTSLGTLGGFLVYQIAIDWQNFQTELENFVVISQENVKLNMILALPILISIIVFVGVTLRKNREFFKDKVSLSLLMTITIFYLIYSVIELTLASLIGAFLGSIIDEFIFTPISLRNKELFEENKDIDVEYEKEMRRIKARKKVKEELDGSV